MSEISGKKVLIANRGEIACRVISSCHKLGISTVAIYSDADAQSMHVEQADESVHVGASKAAESYLKHEYIIEQAVALGVDAIHPGYGFLSESTDFAEAIVNAGMKWIGPAPITITEMGDKDRARKIAVQSGVPVLPGSERFNDGDLGGIVEAGESVGYPLLVKASAGGGGIGMRRVDSESDLLGTAESTQSMAKRAFNDGTIFLERFVENARHIEVQLFGDGLGNAIHLYERDCSVQRRFQKVVEESPAPNLSQDLRDEMTLCAVRLAKAQKYEGAGTVEFVFDVDSQKYYFLEMNTRVQVEHPVTEMVTGIDIVAMQLKQALGHEKLDLRQADVKTNGAAIECRIYAEDPAKNFLPSPGNLNTLVFPASSEHVRIDTGFRQGDKVTAYYDPMIAKLIAYSENRDHAIFLMKKALSELEIDGTKCNHHFLRKIIEHPAFSVGDITTTFIDRYSDQLMG